MSATHYSTVKVYWSDSSKDGKAMREYALRHFNDRVWTVEPGVDVVGYIVTRLRTQAMELTDATQSFDYRLTRSDELVIKVEHSSRAVCDVVLHIVKGNVTLRKKADAAQENKNKTTTKIEPNNGKR